MNRPWTAAERDPLQEREVDVDEAGQAISIGRIKHAIAGTGLRTKRWRLDMVVEPFFARTWRSRWMGSGDRWSLLIEDQHLVHARIAGMHGLRLYVR